MGWRDRDYNQYHDQGQRFSSGFWFLLFGSIPIGTWSGIRIRVHMSLVLLIAINLLIAGLRGGPFVINALTSSVILFALVLLHEFGHCYAARAVGGDAEEVLLWPLGGLASINTPHRPWPTFVGVAGGPLVNVIVCAITGTILMAFAGFTFHLPLNPLLAFSPDSVLQSNSYRVFATSNLTFYSWWIFSTSWMLLVFNLLPIFPMDGGRLMQAALWPRFGYYKSMNFACITGIIGGVGMMMIGLATGAGGFLLVFLGLSGILTCYQMRLALQAMGPEEYQDAMDFSASLRDAPPRRRRHSKGWFRAAARKAAKEQAEQARIDAILAKVHDKGLHSLTWWERRTLRKATERQRQRELAERL